ncbi:MAG: alpha-L-rhamnosidase N-terminal domain-containing protein [Planctomycetes bacterium]|nr:alpha-L-rhamnosidase N-terminal domain-containing protein [Planctomycetota bacterium]
MPGKYCWYATPIDLSPARWVWLPSERTLPNTFVLFRRELDLKEVPEKAKGWITADSRYLLTVNGQRIQWGPAPADPRWPDLDPIELSNFLRPGKNVIGIEVLFYGHGDGTWAMGKPGVVFCLTCKWPGGREEKVFTDGDWKCHLDRAHKPGQPKRCFLRALQEKFDARSYPEGWDEPGFEPDENWLSAMELDVRADRPVACGSYFEYLNGGTVQSPRAALRTRQIPLMRETDVSVEGLRDSGRVTWKRDPDDWFDYRVPDSFEINSEGTAEEIEEGAWEFPAPSVPEEGVYATFELEEQVVGWPYFTITAPEGTTVELICQESHDPDGPPWLDTHFYSWSRFICRGGKNRFEPFDFESLRWIQLHIRGNTEPVRVGNVGVRRRTCDWPHEPRIECDDPELQRLIDAGINTLRNCAQETCVDGMGRERQQYSGDVGHQLHAIRYAFGEMRQPARFLRTYSEGLTKDGYFLDCWPGYDRLARLMQRQVGATEWGPLLDHGVGFVFDAWHHYMQTGEEEALKEPYPRLIRFAEYLKSLRNTMEMLPVENIGVPTVWMDHDAYQQQRHKQCAFNLYAAAMLKHALAPMARVFGDLHLSRYFIDTGQDILDATVDAFWSKKQGLFVNNKRWLREEGEPRLCDRSLATSLLFDQCPGGLIEPALEALVECPPNMGLSYPANANWRLWALCRWGRADVVINEFRDRWAQLPSVRLNNTIQESWNASPDSTDQWSHCAVSPIYILFQDIAGIRPLEPGFKKCQIRPQLGDLNRLELTAHTVVGPIEFRAEKCDQGHRLQIATPGSCECELRVPESTELDLPEIGTTVRPGLKRYKLERDASNEFVLPQKVMNDVQ